MEVPEVVLTQARWRALLSLGFAGVLIAGLVAIAAVPSQDPADAQPFAGGWRWFTVLWLCGVAFFGWLLVRAVRELRHPTELRLGAAGIELRRGAGADRVWGWSDIYDIRIETVGWGDGAQRAVRFSEWERTGRDATLHGGFDGLAVNKLLEVLIWYAAAARGEATSAAPPYLSR